MREQPELTVEEVPMGELVPYARNAKVHTREQVDQIAKSIEDYGFNDPVGVWDGPGGLEIVEGHGRVLAAKKLGLAAVPVIRLDHLSDEQRREYALVHNKLNLNTGWDFDALDAELADMPDFDAGDFGFDVDVSEIDDFGLHPEEDDVPEQVEPRCKLGDIWQLGGHRLMCGSSADAGDMALLMAGDKADCVFTDPPYGVAIGSKNAELNSVQPSERCCENIKGDTMTEEQLYDMLKCAFVNVRESCKDDASYYVTSPQGGSLGLMMMMMKDAGLPVRHVLMWKKDSATFSLGRLDYDYQHEPMFYTWTKKHHNYRKGGFRTTVWELPKPRKCDLHPTMKPVALVENVLLDATKEGDIVLDAFGGSGTTIVAAEELGRKARLMELDPHYCDVIIERWQSLTGGTAKLVERR